MSDEADKATLAEVDVMLVGIEAAVRELKDHRAEGIERLCLSGLMLVGDLVLDLERLEDILYRAHFNEAGGSTEMLRIASAHRARPRVRKPAGRCYELCSRTFLNLPDPDGWLLVHGDGNGAPEVGRTGHAWLEFGEVAFDSESGKHVAKERYYQTYRLTVHARYDLRQAAEQMTATGHFGPWEGS